MPSLKGLLVVLATCAALAGIDASAATKTWTGGAGDGDLNWFNDANWSEGTAPSDGDDVIFPANVASSLLSPVNNINSLALNSVTFQGGGYLVGGNALSVSAGVNNNSGALNAFNCPLTLTHDQSFTVNGTTLINATIDLSGFTLTVSSASSTSVELQDVISGTGGITKIGGGSLKIAKNNTYTGKTLVTGGTVIIDRERSLGGDPALFTADQLTLNGGALQVINDVVIGAVNTKLGITLGASGGTMLIDSGSTAEVKNAITGTGTLAKSGNGTLKLSAANSYSGKTTVSAGTLSINGEDRLGPNPASSASDQLTVNGGATLNAFGSFTIDDANRGLSLATGTATILVDSGVTMNVARPIAGTGLLKKMGAGTLKLSAQNTYGGGTTLSAGQLDINADNALGTGTFTIGAATIIDNSSASSVNLSNNNAQNWNANFTFVGTQNLNLGNGAVSLSANRSVTVTANTLTVGGIISGINRSLSKSGAGTLTLSGVNTYSGATAVNAGKMLVNGSLASSSAVTVATVATLGGSGTAAGTVALNGTVAPGNSVESLDTGTETWSGGASYTFEMSNATGIAGTGWDLLNITGDLNIAAAIDTPFTVKVYSFSDATTLGNTANFNNTLDYQWPIATVSGTITGFDATKFIVNASNFQNDKGSGQFAIRLSSDGKSVNLVFIPTCAIGQTTRNYVIGGDDKVHMYFSNPFGFDAGGALEASKLVNCTITAATAYGPSGAVGTVSSLPLNTVGSSAAIPSGTTRLEVVATKSGSGSATVDVQVKDACGSFAGFDPVFTELKVQQGGIVRQTFNDIPSAERYVHVVNGTPGLKWASIVVNGNVYSLNPLANGQSVMLDVGASMGEGNGNVVTLMGQGVAGASATVTIGDQSIVKAVSGVATVTKGDEAQRILQLVAAGESPTVKIATIGDKVTVSWSDLWDGFEVQSCPSLAPDGKWTTVPVTPVLADGQFSVTMPPDSGTFIRLIKP